MSIERVAQTLANSLQAEQTNSLMQELRQLETAPDFALVLLTIVESTQLDTLVRLAAAVYFKNFLNRRWTDLEGNHKLSADVVTTVKSRIVQMMMELENDNLKKQVGECISLIASLDFPEKWVDLVDQLVAGLSSDLLRNVNGVLAVAHLIFKRWRPLFALDELFLEIKFVLEKFCEPFMKVMIATDAAISAGPDNVTLVQHFENLFLCTKLYYDFNCQDIPEFFEDNMQTMMEVMHRYLVYQNEVLTDPSEEDQADVLIKLKGAICDLIQIYATRYGEIFDPLISRFVQAVWDELLKVTLQVKFDTLALKLLKYLTSVIKIPKYFDIFNAADVLGTIVTDVVVPNITLREADEELFEDDPLEFIRRDIENGELSLRRAAATDFLRELKDKNESLVTETVMGYVNQFLAAYAADSTQWRQKDTAVNCFIAVATKGNVTGAGVSATNLLVDVVAFFQQNVAGDLVGQGTHPLLVVDAIRYIYVFRNQLSKQQLVETFPLLLSHLATENYVVSTYSAVTVEKVLSLKTQERTSLFNKEDVKPVATNLVETLFAKIRAASSSVGKLSENEYLLKCLMRVLILNGDNFVSAGETAFVGQILTNLLDIIAKVSENPTNPKFNHYCFECVAIVVNYNHGGDAKYINAYMDVLLPRLLDILKFDVTEFIPYVLQIYAFALELLQKATTNTALPGYYKELIKPLLAPPLWEMRGNIPALTRLIIDIIVFDRNSYDNDIEALLGVYQKLIASKANDAFGFDLMEIILLYVDMKVLLPYIKQIAGLLLTRLQSAKTSKLASRFVVCLCKLALVDSNYVNKSQGRVNLLGPEFVTQFVDQLQDLLFRMVFNGVIEPQLQQTFSFQQSKILVLGLAALVTRNPDFHPGGKYADLFARIANYAFLLTAHKRGFQSAYMAGESDELEDFGEYDKSVFVFGSSFSRLVVIGRKTFDPVADIRPQDTRAAFLTIMREFGSGNPAVLEGLDVLLRKDIGV